METFSAAMRRRFHHLFAQPLAWIRYVWIREIRHREVMFRENPRFADWRPMYKVSRAALARLTGKTPAQLDGLFEELIPLHDALVAEAGAVPSAGALMQAPLLYLLVRSTAPSWMVETGISSGYSARLILEAMERNGAGHLDSIGIDVFGILANARPALGDRQIGWLVPERLKSRWSLHKGTSEEHLPRLLAAAPTPLDVFLHDSAHQYPVMHWEYSTAWPHLRPGGFLASHDIHTNLAWYDFMRGNKLSGDEQLDHDLGVVKVPSVG